MGRSSGLGGIIEGVTGKGGTLIGRGGGIPMPILPTESVGMMSGSQRTKKDERKSSFGGARQVTRVDPVTGLKYGGLEIFNNETGKYEPKYKIPTREEFDARAAEKAKSQPPRKPMSTEERARQEAMAAKERAMIEEAKAKLGLTPKFDPSKPSAVMETERVNVQDPTLGGPPEREVPMPKERDTSPRGRAPFSPDERAMARDAFFEKMFSRADERKQSKAMDQEERRNVMDARRDEAAMRGSERGMRNEGRGRNSSARRMLPGRGRRRRDFTRRRSKMEGRRSREERAAFRDRFVSTLR